MLGVEKRPITVSRSSVLACSIFCPVPERFLMIIFMEAESDILIADSDSDEIAFPPNVNCIDSALDEASMTDSAKLSGFCEIGAKSEIGINS